jgi:predicted cupin superfamily sugar epimerase
MKVAMTAEEVIQTLRLEPHPEGGHYAETFRDDRGGLRGHSTAIYYLLQEGETSAWHRIDATEVWHWYAGAPLELQVLVDGEEAVGHTLGPALDAGMRPQAVVPAGAWQSAASAGAWTLVGCTVAPGFIFETFELAPDDFLSASDEGL